MVINAPNANNNKKIVADMPPINPASANAYGNDNIPPPNTAFDKLKIDPNNPDVVS